MTSSATYVFVAHNENRRGRKSKICKHARLESQRIKKARSREFLHSSKFLIATADQIPQAAASSSGTQRQAVNKKSTRAATENRFCKGRSLDRDVVLKGSQEEERSRLGIAEPSGSGALNDTANWIATGSFPRIAIRCGGSEDETESSEGQEPFGLDGGFFQSLLYEDLNVFEVAFAPDAPDRTRRTRRRTLRRRFLMTNGSTPSVSRTAPLQYQRGYGSHCSETDMCWGMR